jgi:hypothetical protein
MQREKFNRMNTFLLLIKIKLFYFNKIKKDNSLERPLVHKNCQRSNKIFKKNIYKEIHIKKVNL